MLLMLLMHSVLSLLGFFVLIVVVLVANVTCIVESGLYLYTLCFLEYSICFSN